MSTLRIQYSYTPNLMPQPSGIDGKLPVIYGRVVRNYDSNGKPIESLRKLNGKSPRVLPTANAELYTKIHERAVALGEKALDIPLTEAELAGFNMLTANFFTHNGVENALVDVTVESTPINRANPKVIANLKGLRELCKRLGVEFTLDMAKKLENINFTYLCDHIVEITKTEIKSFAINGGNDKDYSDFENMWNDDTTTAPPVVITNSSPTNEQLANAANQVQEKIKAATLLFNEWNNATVARTKTAKGKALDPLVAELRAMPDSAFEGLTDQENEQLDILLALPATNV